LRRAFEEAAADPLSERERAVTTLEAIQKLTAHIDREEREGFFGGSD
jgi:hypothetical protein